jgi:hypothetical protein
MTPAQALQMIDQALQQINATRATHTALQQALMTLAKLVPAEEPK